MSATIVTVLILVVIVHVSVSFVIDKGPTDNGNISGITFFHAVKPKPEPSIWNLGRDSKLTINTFSHMIPDQSKLSKIFQDTRHNGNKLKDNTLKTEKIPTDIFSKLNYLKPKASPSDHAHAQQSNLARTFAPDNVDDMAPPFPSNVFGADTTRNKIISGKGKMDAVSFTAFDSFDTTNIVESKPSSNPFLIFDDPNVGVQMTSSDITSSGVLPGNPNSNIQPVDVNSGKAETPFSYLGGASIETNKIDTPIDFSQLGLINDNPNPNADVVNDFNYVGLDPPPVSSTDMAPGNNEIVRPFPFGQVQDGTQNKRTGPSMQAIGGFVDNSKKPVMRMASKFVDLSGRQPPKMSVTGGFVEAKTTEKPVLMPSLGTNLGDITLPGMDSISKGGQFGQGNDVNNNTQILSTDNFQNTNDVSLNPGNVDGSEGSNIPAVGKNLKVDMLYPQAPFPTNAQSTFPSTPMQGQLSPNAVPNSQTSDILNVEAAVVTNVGGQMTQLDNTIKTNTLATNKRNHSVINGATISDTSGVRSTQQIVPPVDTNSQGNTNVQNGGQTVPQTNNAGVVPLQGNRNANNGRFMTDPTVQIIKTSIDQNMPSTSGGVDANWPSNLQQNVASNGINVPSMNSATGQSNTGMIEATNGNSRLNNIVIPNQMVNTGNMNDVVGRQNVNNAELGRINSGLNRVDSNNGQTVTTITGINSGQNIESRNAGINNNVMNGQVNNNGQMVNNLGILTNNGMRGQNAINNQIIPNNAMATGNSNIPQDMVNKNTNIGTGNINGVTNANSIRNDAGNGQIGQANGQFINTNVLPNSLNQQSNMRNSLNQQSTMPNSLNQQSNMRNSLNQQSNMPGVLQSTNNMPVNVNGLSGQGSIRRSNVNDQFIPNNIPSGQGNSIGNQMNGKNQFESNIVNTPMRANQNNQNMLLNPNQQLRVGQFNNGNIPPNNPVLMRNGELPASNANVGQFQQGNAIQRSQMQANSVTNQANMNTLINARPFDNVIQGTTVNNALTNGAQTRKNINPANPNMNTQIRSNIPINQFGPNQGQIQVPSNSNGNKVGQTMNGQFQNGGSIPMATGRGNLQNVGGNSFVQNSQPIQNGLSLMKSNIQNQPGLPSLPVNTNNAPNMANNAQNMANNAPNMANNVPNMANNARNLANNAPNMANNVPNMANNAPNMANNAPNMANNANPFVNPQNIPPNTFANSLPTNQFRTGVPQPFGNSVLNQQNNGLFRPNNIPFNPNQLSNGPIGNIPRLPSNGNFRNNMPFPPNFLPNNLNRNFNNGGSVPFQGNPFGGPFNTPDFPMNNGIGPNFLGNGPFNGNQFPPTGPINRPFIPFT